MEADKYEKIYAKYVKQKFWVFEWLVKVSEKHIGTEYHLTIPALEDNGKIIINGQIYKRSR